MIKEMVPIPAGAMFYVTTGEYSDYYVTGVFRATAEINATALLNEWLEAHPEQTKSFAFRDYEFFAWAAKKGLFEPVEAYEWHLTDNAIAREMFVSKDEGK